jgi:hypothetical protein
MICTAAVAAQFVGGKATRDALFLTSLDFTSLPAMLMATSVFSIALVAAYGRLATAIPPATLVPAAFLASAVLSLAEWLLRSSTPAATAIVLYLHVSAVFPLLASGIWLLASERFDPRAAKTGFGRIAAAGTLGGLVGAAVSERVAALAGAPAMLLFLAGSQIVTAWLVRRLLAEDEQTASRASAPGLPEAPPKQARRSGLRVVAEAPHLRHLAALVLLGTTGAALLEYLFKAKAVETFGPGDHLLRFFAIYYAATSLITLAFQTFSTRAVLERFGLAMTTSTPSIALLAGSLGSLLAPGLGGLLIARGGESVFRASWFRAGYELFYTPLPASEKRAAKSVIDVSFDRLGDAIGGGLVRLAIVFLPTAHSQTILSLAAASAVGAIILASSLNRWYRRTLERSLLARAGEIDLVPTFNDALPTELVSGRTPGSVTSAPTVEPAIRTLSVDADVQDALWLRSRDKEHVIEILSRQRGLPPALVAGAIPLLANPSFADHALFALRNVAEERVGQLVDALLDPNQDYAVRRRLARVFSVCVSQRAADGLLLALDDTRFDVRFQAARSLAAMLEKNCLLRIDRERVFEVVRKEVAVSRPVWESQRLLDEFISRSALDEFVRDRAGQSLAHVFTLLSLVLPAEPLRLAFRALQSPDAGMRGTALEYLEAVLPPPIRERLWPFLVRTPPAPPSRPRDEIMAELVRSSESITLRRIASACI